MDECIFVDGRRRREGKESFLVEGISRRKAVLNGALRERNGCAGQRITALLGFPRFFSSVAWKKIFGGRCSSSSSSLGSDRQ